MLISFIESYASGKSFLQKGDPNIDANQELVALGMANVGGGLFQAYPGGGEPPRQLSVARLVPRLKSQPW